MPFFHAKTPLDRAFEISLLLKGLDGLLETVSGILFLFVKPDLVLRKGQLSVLSGPGLGFELDWDAVGRAEEAYFASVNG